MEIRYINDNEEKLRRWIEELTSKPTDLLAHTAEFQHAYFGAFHDEKIIGFSVVLKTDKWILDALFVHPDHRGRGIAGELTKARLAFARQNGAKEIWYCCGDQNTTSLSSHKGYKFVKVRKATPEEAPAPSHWYKMNI
ncbi:MAG: hypothetical protein A2270_01130 [Elusimicrobia bacterium RIFOXYA12_FULL_51_18]|nr:MAG: hypothetical protein A2270_01130 [Elusimicrobia bacterium RIFOXYA12_FULL_51_18]OGS31094.1 MAG: hypothetical protein A2218_02005 [Elusimicrobia bacterium RIFOXYA2_FULL_53_38]